MYFGGKQRGRCRRAFALVTAFVLAWGLLITAQAEQPEKPRKVRLGYLLLNGFQEESVTEQEGRTVTVRTGYGYDYMQMMRYYAGWEYEYVHGTWEELTRMLARGEIDMLSHVARSVEREELYLFSTEPQCQETHYLYVDGPSASIDPNDLSTLNGKNIGVIAGDVRSEQFVDWCEERGIVCNILPYPDIEAIHVAMHSGDVHAASVSRRSIATVPDGKWRPLIRFGDSPVYIAVKRGAEGEELLRQVNDAQAQILAINEDYGAELQARYLADHTIAAPLLTEEEKQWLSERSAIIVGYCDGRRPLAYKDENGELAGLLADYLSVITKAFDIKFNAVSYPDGLSLMNALLSGEVDVIAPVGYNFGMAEEYGLMITNPIMVETMVAVFKGYKGNQPKDIFEQIAILDTSITEKDYAKRYYPDSEWARADSIEEAIRFVDEDKAGCYIIRSSTWSWYKNEYPLLGELQVLTLPNANDVNMAIRAEDWMLLPILNKGISLMTEADVDQSVVAYSEGRDELTLSMLIRENPFTSAVILVAAFLLCSLVFVFYRLQTEQRYLRRLEIANAAAEAARKEAERANQAKSTFLTSMSHDIRTPMNAIIGMTTLASRHLNSPEYVRNCLSKVTLASDHLLTLINDVLDINKIESGKLSLTPTVFSLADSIMNLANIGRHQLQEKNHRFEIRVHNIQQEYLFADELRINQIFINLLSNAVKYTPPNGRITIDVKQEPVPGEREKVRVIFMVEDTGIGMTREFQQHMYELFAMANRSSRTVMGSGVGLSICKQLVDLMAGQITCESELGVGTKFTVTLDLAVADRVVDNLVLPPMKLLLVDDDEVFLATAADTLRDMGLQPDCVSSGAKAIAAVKQKHADGKDYPLIIIDWQMPEMDGLETTRRIRATVGEEVSIIVISAYAPEDIRDAALAAGANGFINKPFFRSNAYMSISEIMGLRDEGEDHLNEHHRRVRGMNVLVAEDNDLNWEIARELLAMYEITAERAENGAICLEMLEKGSPGQYDVILMDIQMPVMDGYAATRAIRSHERTELSRIPIIAMTADAYTEDVLLCAQAGMNFHIPKPIDMERLLEVLGELRQK